MSSIAHPSVTTTRGSMARADTQALALSPPESVISPVGFVYDSYANYHRRRTHEISSSLCIGRRLGGCHHISMRRQECKSINQYWPQCNLVSVNSPASFSCMTGINVSKSRLTIYSEFVNTTHRQERQAEPRRRVPRESDLRGMVENAGAVAGRCM